MIDRRCLPGVQCVDCDLPGRGVTVAARHVAR